MNGWNRVILFTICYTLLYISSNDPVCYDPGLLLLGRTWTIYVCNISVARSSFNDWLRVYESLHNNDVIMRTMASQITSVSVVCPAVASGSVQRKHQSSASLAIVRGIHRWPVNFPHKRSETRKLFPFEDVIMICSHTALFSLNKKTVHFLTI